MKRVSFVTALIAAFLLLSPLSAVAQQRGATLKAPTAPTPIEVRERTIQDLLYFPFTCIKADMSTRELAWQAIENTFGSCENINGSPGLHANGSFDFTYRGVAIGLCNFDWMDDRAWYHFYFSEKSKADQFYNTMVKDIQGAGIPLTKDKIYGGMSNRKNPISIFKWVSVATPVKVKEADASNLETPNVVGKYKVELGIYKRKRK